MKYLNIAIFCLMVSFPLFQSTGFAFNPGTEHVISGKTMGTFYTIKFISSKKESSSDWKSRVDIRLKEVNKRLSIFDPKSEISGFNRQEIKKELKISSDFYAVLFSAQKLYQLTEGAWDGTVKPLVDLWGFGTQKSENKIPDPEKIAFALSRVGFHHIDIKGYPAVYKKTAITLDLGSIAKGYGVDAVAALFSESGIHDVLVEIGGELYASGKNKKGASWTVGISKPDKQFANQALFKVVRLNNMAIATSGNYRNFFEKEKKTYSHIIDPKTGVPVDNNIVSASVISKDCTFADGLATALMIMELQKGLLLVNSLEDTECLIIQKTGQALISHTSDNFDRFVAN